MNGVGTVYADWEFLDAKQQDDMQALRNRINDHFIAEVEAFYKMHPELRVYWQFTLSARVREEQKL